MISVPAIFNRFATKHELFVRALMPERVYSADMIGAALAAPRSRDRLIAAAEAILVYLRTEMPGMLPLMADPTVGRALFKSHLNQDPFLVLRGVITQCLLARTKEGRLTTATVENVANVLVLALFGLAALETAGFQQNEIVRKLDVTAMVGALWSGAWR